jgi:hypothetical protein
MPTYRVQIEASNLLVNMDGRPGKHGFITFRFVQADEPVAAENAAVQMIRDDAELRGSILNQHPQRARRSARDGCAGNRRMGIGRDAAAAQPRLVSDANETLVAILAALRPGLGR